MLVRQLPAESATATVLRLRARDEGVTSSTPHDPETEQWSRIEHLLASVRDELHFLRYAYTLMNSDKNNRPKWRPEPLARPGVQSKKQRAALQPEQHSVLANYLARAQGSDVTYN